jgi:hypothetical protein
MPSATVPGQYATIGAILDPPLFSLDITFKPSFVACIDKSRSRDEDKKLKRPGGNGGGPLWEKNNWGGGGRNKGASNFQTEEYLIIPCDIRVKRYFEN